MERVESGERALRVSRPRAGGWGEGKNEPREKDFCTRVATSPEAYPRLRWRGAAADTTRYS